MGRYIIEEMYAFVADEEQGEGLMAFMNLDGVLMPMVGADMDRVKSLVPMAKQISKATGKIFKILKFTNRIDITKDMIGDE